MIKNSTFPNESILELAIKLESEMLEFFTFNKNLDNMMDIVSLPIPKNEESLLPIKYNYTQKIA